MIIDDIYVKDDIHIYFLVVNKIYDTNNNPLVL